MLSCFVFRNFIEIFVLDILKEVLFLSLSNFYDNVFIRNTCELCVNIHYVKNICYSYYFNKNDFTILIFYILYIRAFIFK